MSRGKAWIMGLALALVVIGGVVATLLVLPLLKRADLPGPGSARYEEMVSAFFSGVAALDTDANTIARDALLRATRLIPEEPAAWANLALAHVRLGDHDPAAVALAQAQALAPESGAIQELLALLEQRRGRFPEAIEHLKRAIELDPTNLKPRYALVQEWERQGESDAQALRTLGEVLEVAPDNLAALIDRARLAAKVGDAQALADVVRRLEGPAGSWPTQVQDRYQALRQAVSGDNSRLVAARVVVLRNVLMTVPEFRRGLSALELPAGTIGQPLQRFLRLQPPPPTPAPPDEAIAFPAGPLGNGPPRNAQAVFLLPNPRDGTATPLEADGGELRRADGSGVIAPFPGGPEANAPSLHGVAVADWNSDSLPDLILAGAGGVRILRQSSDGSFEDVTASTQLPPETVNASAFGAWAADIELDGDLDFVVGQQAGPTQVLRNQGDGTFTPIPLFEAVANLRAFAWADLDHDGDPDAAFLDDQGALSVLDNERSGRFRARARPDGLGPMRALAVADLDSDGAMDLVLLAQGAIHRLSDRQDGSAWELAEVVRWSETPAPNDAGAPRAEAARLLCVDLDNNGGVDLVAAGPGGARIWLDAGADTAYLPAAAPEFRPSGAFDLNGDGRLDLVGLTTEGQPVRGLGRGARAYGWLAVRPQAAKAVGDGRINSFGVGGEMQLRAGLLVQNQVIAGPIVHFGLGTHPGADVVRVVWPNGTTQAEFDPQGNRAIVAEQRLKGSCPFIYAHDGTKIQFVTDFLWRSPLGLRINAQDTAGVSQTEDWIKIRGDQLAPLGPPDNAYDIRLTAELWETHFWDHVALMVVDHPENTEVFVDERFARQPPALAVHVTGRPQPVAAARDDQGHDVAPIVRERDGVFLDTFGRGPYQGVTRDHWVEIEVGDQPPSDRKLVLIAEGWVHPTDSSINVALGQGRHDPPRGLVLEVPTADGGWVVARDDLGFPAGKNKTILISLDGVFRPGAPRTFRLRTNLEIYWDALSVAPIEDNIALKIQRLPPSRADLRLRGYSVMTQRNPSSPEVPRYDMLAGSGQRWNDLIGFYTRFGDVLELLEKVDDRYVIANAGDEVVLRFPAQGPPPPGWSRDFVLIGDGWNKDGDYNTAFSKTVLPLPSHARPAYDTPPGALEDDPVYREHPDDWERYHTRYITPQVFRDRLRPRSVARP